MISKSDVFVIQRNKFTGKGWKKKFNANNNQALAGVDILLLDKVLRFK